MSGSSLTEDGIGPSGSHEAENMPTCGFIGLGDMGRPIAARIAGAGFALRLWARRAASLDGLLQEQVLSCPTPRQLGAVCDFVGVCLRTDEEIFDVVLRQPDGLLHEMRPGAVLMIHSTVLPETIFRLNEEAQARGVQLLDAPVSGGGKGAARGTLTVLIGGDADTVEKAMPVLRSFASNCPHVGALGSAQMLKLINNNLCYANLSLSIAALDLAEELGIDPAMAAAVIATSSGASHGLDLIRNNLSLKKMTGDTSNVPKDIKHLVDVAEQKGIALSPLMEVSLTALTALKAYVAAGSPGLSR